MTGSWDTWSTASVSVGIGAGTHTIGIVQDASDSGNVNLDSIAVTPTGAGYPADNDPLSTTGYGAGPTDVLGGWDRSLDNPDVLPMPEHPGILDRDGWYLLDDTRTRADSTRDRPSHGTQPYQDGYFFGYGQNYKQGLTDLNTLTGGTDLLPQSAYGVWYSRYYAYIDIGLREHAAAHVPLHVHADRLAGRRHRLEVTVAVERLELELRAVPRPAELHELDQTAEPLRSR